jgi:hypothetical protein
MHTPDQMVTWNAGLTAPEKLSPGAGGYNLSGVLRRSAGFGLAILLAGALTGSAAAQSQRLIFPGDVARFEFPLASPRTSAMVGRILDVSRGESLFGAEWEAEPALGEVWPLVAISRGKVPVTLHLGTEVYARFSLADKSSALISDDWQVNGVLTADYRRWRLAFEAYHESSHLGDEYRDRFPTVTRVNWSREIVGLWAGYVVGDVEFRGNLSYAAIDAVNVGRGGASLAVDYVGRRGGFLGKHLQPVLAGFADAQEYTDWQVTWSGRAGVRLPDGVGRRGMALLLDFLDGTSPQRQFYLSRTRYAGIEVRFDL